MRRRITFTTTVLSLLSLSVGASIGWTDDAKPTAKPAVASTEKQAAAKQEAKLTKLMTGCSLVGQFTVDGKPMSPKPERYVIKSFKKIEGTEKIWQIIATIKYGQVNADFPISLPIEWVGGDTAVMVFDDLKIPLLGEFSGRVMFHGDRYVGTWQHGKVGGHMFGRIEKAKDAKKEPKNEDKK